MMLTTRVDRADRQAWLDVGVRAVPATPFDLLPLRAQLREVLGWTA